MSTVLLIARDRVALALVATTLEREGYKIIHKQRSSEDSGCHGAPGVASEQQREMRDSFVVMVKTALNTCRASASQSARSSSEPEPYPKERASVILSPGLSEPVPHALLRWARVVVPVVCAPYDVRTVTDWGRLVVASPGALRSWCAIAGISSGRSLLFARLLRAVTLHANRQHRFENVLDVVDRRTLAKMVHLCGGTQVSEPPPSVDQFLQRQSLVSDWNAIVELRRLLHDPLGAGPAIHTVPLETNRVSAR